LLLLAVGHASGQYYGGNHDCPEWSVCLSWANEYPLKILQPPLLSSSVAADLDTLVAYSEHIGANGECKYGVTSVDAKHSRQCITRGCGATYHTCRCVDAEEANRAKQRSKDGLKIAGYVFLGITFVMMAFWLKLMAGAHNSHDTDMSGGVCSYCCWLVGFILVVCGFLAVHLDTFWEGCGDKNTSPRYVYHTLYQSDGAVDSDSAESTMEVGSRDLVTFCALQKSIECITVCDPPSSALGLLGAVAPESLCGVGSTCEVEVAKCMGRIAANAVSLLNVTVDEEEYDSGYDKAGEQAKGYIALGVMLGACVFVSLVAVCLQSDFSLSQVSPVRTRAVVTVPTTVVAAPPAPPAAPAAVDDAPPAYHPAMGVQYDSENAGVKTSAF